MITQQVYNEIIKYVPGRAKRLIGFVNVDPLELTHDVIADTNFKGDNWQQLVDRYIYASVGEYNNRAVSLEDMNKPNPRVEELWRCQDCESDFPKSKFHMSHRICNKCYYRKNSDRLKENNARWKRLNPDKERACKQKWRDENRDIINEKQRKWRAENREKIREYARKRRAKNAEKLKEYQREYYLKNKAKKTQL